jgi:NADH-quinone oxidoreductase subunit G
MLFADRCIMCSRCVRFEQEISGAGSLAIVNRGNRCEIDVFPGVPLNHKMSGNVGDLCPVGALEDKDFLYKQRVWFLRDSPSVCPGCSTGCAIWADVNPTTNTLWRLRPRTDLQVNQYWMCDEGRYGAKYLHSPVRLVGPVLRRATAASGAPAGATAADGGASGSTASAVLEKPASTAGDWDAIYRAFADGVLALLEKHGPGAAAAVISPFATNEEAWLMGKLVKSMGEPARLYLGPVPVAGNEEVFKSGFTIRPEKCPNKKGVSTVLAALDGAVRSVDQCVGELRAGTIKCLIVLGGGPDPALLDAFADDFRRAEFLIVIDILAGKLTDAADLLMAGAAFSEREGSYLNHAGVLRVFDWAMRPPGSARRTGQIIADLAGRPGLFNAADVRREMAGEIPTFAEAAGRGTAEGVSPSKPN